MKTKLLITGASGFLGWNLCRQALYHWDVVGLYQHHPVTISGAGIFCLDLTDYGALKMLFRQVKPQAVIHTAAASRPDFCQQHPDASYKINVTASVNLAGLCADNSIPFVFTSSDLVFDGENPPYSESSPAYPINIYGEQKLRAESEILLCYPPAVICRLPLMFGTTMGPTRSFTDQIITATHKGEALTLFFDEFRTPVDTQSAARGLLLAIQRFHGEIVHLGGKSRVSRFEMGCLIEKLMNIQNPAIRKLSRKAVPSLSPRPADVSLDSSKAFARGYTPTDLEPALRQAISNYHST